MLPRTIAQALTAGRASIVPNECQHPFLGPEELASSWQLLRVPLTAPEVQ